MTAILAIALLFAQGAIGTPLQAVTGTASWYDNGNGIYAAAGPDLRVGDWRGRTVHVCADVCVDVTLTDWCACPKRLIDLSSDAFRQLAPLSRGLVKVTVSWGGPDPTTPATDAGIAPEPLTGPSWLPVNVGGYSMRPI